ncbi:DDE superfamily endonuclease [Acidocella aminolytica 101 = DSM 11237]|uniref:Transposase n=1 Tax=Acidocella aminolytica 101 = DSM 11237 TaxID=1120923 RepID=A0A0D6PCJ8_9PROT|nr:transposase [Acidocella aminolytica 101 = DSM 11237]GBQ40033.1 transposase [Acidocella aminolytica 101 = DSM 11237]SHF14579.1 DDE superfamily endonuclease [Acidocella aminolytica 101 = DSM 11237]
MQLEVKLLTQADRLIGGDDMALDVDDTASPKQGSHSVGVAPQYVLALGKKTNCRMLVSLMLARGEVPVMVGLRLLLPESWTRDPASLQRAHVPEVRQVFSSKSEIAIKEIDRIMAADVRFG